MQLTPEQLRQFDEQDKIPIVLPLAESRLVSRPMVWGSRFTLDSSLLGLTRIDGLDTRRVRRSGRLR